MRAEGVFLSVLAATNALACCGVGAGGAPVRFAGQTNLIVWDKNHGVEHFVRDAKFTTTAKDLGFIAPTPGRPNIGTAEPSVFANLDALRPTKGKEETAGTKSMKSAAPGAVTFVEAKDVAGYHATVLKATDAAELSAWLAKNGYPSPQYLTDWVAPYVKKGWYLTAFRVNGEATGPVRMSFETKTPFNPYSVPAANGGQIPLKVYYVSAGREVPKVGGEGAWRKPQWSVSMTAAQVGELADNLYLTPDRLPEHAHLTVYDDDQFGKPGLDDLYFVPDERPVQAGVGAAVGIAILAAGIVVRRSRRKKTPLSPATAPNDPRPVADDR